MSLEAVVFQQLQSSSNHASTKDYKENFTLDRDMDTYPSTTLMNIESPPSSSSKRTIPPTSNFEESTIVCCGTTRRRRKRRRSNNEINKFCDEKSRKIEEERQRQKHIEVERSRRKQINDYLSILGSLMPPSYSLRGDQASIVEGAINFVKELEQLLQYLNSHHKRIKLHHQTKLTSFHNTPSPLSDFFSFPQYSTTTTTTTTNIKGEEPPEEAVADVEVQMVERYVTVKVLSRKKPKQLLRMLVEMEYAHLIVMHLNVTSIDGFVLYSFSLKKEDECQLNTVDEIATAVYDMIRKIQHHAEC